MLQSALITSINTRLIPSTANNNENNKEKRKIYVQKHLDATSVETPILYINETNFNLFFSRSQGRTEQGAWVNFKRPNFKGKHIHLIGVNGTNGFSQFRVHRGSFTHELANNFKKDILRAASNFYQRPVAVFVDNAPCHSRIEEVFENPDFSQNYLLRLAPYSPMLYPIAHKREVKKATAATRQVVMATGNNKTIPQTDPETE